MWSLREYLRTNHGIVNAVQLQSRISERLGVVVTVQTLRSLLRQAPSAPRAEMIQLLCDTFDCRSDAFYVFTPDPARARRWAEKRDKGESPARLYGTKAVTATDENAEIPAPATQGEASRKPKSLTQVFTDPRKLFSKRVIHGAEEKI